MNEIKYNFYHLSTRGGNSCNVTTIENAELPKSKIYKKSAPLIQTYDCGFRVDGNNGEYSKGKIFKCIWLIYGKNK